MITVIGSINMDLVTRVATSPRAGETVAGADLMTWCPCPKGVLDDDEDEQEHTAVFAERCAY